jgi:transcriptional regulator with XRE-family HTH domain
VEPDGSFGAWVRELRRRLGLTQGTMGARVGVAQGTVSAWERGKVGASRAVRHRLAAAAAGVRLGPPPEREGEAEGGG